MRGYPTFVLASETGETLYRWWGYSRDAFLNEMGKGLADPTTIVEKQTRYKKNPDLNTAKALANYHYTTGEIKEAVRFYRDAAKFDPESDYTYEIYSAYRSGFRGKIYTKDDVKKAADKALASESVTTRNKMRIYDQMAQAVLMFKDDADLLSYIRQGYEYAKNLNDEDVQYYKKRIEITHTLYIEKNITKAVEMKKQSFKDGWQDNPRDLNSFSWWCFENQINLEEAENLGRKGVKLAEPGSQRGNILDTVAEICNLRGDPKEAVALMEEALKEVPGNEFYTKQLNRYKEIAAK